MEQLANTLFDIILVGTDNVSSILAAQPPIRSLAKSGKSVLHIDVSKYYGSFDATLSLNEFVQFMNREPQAPFTQKTLHQLPVFPIQTAQDEIFSHSRNFNIDLQPKMLYSQGEVVDYMLASGLASYIEFKPVKMGMLWTGENFQQVPCNKSEIFSNESLSMVQKRMLMKFIQFCVKSLEEASFDPDANLVQTMNEKGLSKPLQDILLYAILLIDKEIQKVTLGEALGQIQKYIDSLGMYKQNTAMLYPMYGTSDILQGFCRQCAVFGGNYVIAEDISTEAILALEGVKKLCTSFGELSGLQILVNSSFGHLDRDFQSEYLFSISRAVVICRGDLDSFDGPMLLSVPPGQFGNQKPIYILRTNNSSYSTPVDYSLFYLYKVSQSYEEDIRTFEQFLAVINLEVVLFASFSQEVHRNSGSLVHVNSYASGFELVQHFVRVMQAQAKEVFQKLAPGQEFFPAQAPQVEQDEFDG